MKYQALAPPRGAPLTHLKLPELRAAFEECRLNQQYSDTDEAFGEYEFPDQLLDVIDMLVDRHYLKVHEQSDNEMLRVYVLGGVFLDMMHDK